MDVIKWQLNFGSCNFGPKSYLRSFDFEITRMISDQIANCTPLSSITIINLMNIRQVSV